MRPFVVVAGARPNFMKVAPLLEAMRRHPTHPPFELVHTGQHYDFEMSGVFFEQLGIGAPDVHLDVGSASHGVQTARIMAAFDGYLDRSTEKPRAVIVVGDVNSTMACALVARKRLIPVAHVEAGLRCGDRAMPEEINRIVTDVIADLLFVSEPSGLTNLEREGIPADRVRYAGNVMIDTLVTQLAEARRLDVSTRWQLARGNYAVLTLHRAANVDDAGRLSDLVDFVRELSGDISIVFPVHPRTESRLAELGLRERLDGAAGIHLVSPLGYREFVSLVESSRVVLTDSGGLQEETTYLGIPCVTLRSTTERPITVTSGTNVLVGDDLVAAARAVRAILAGTAERTEAIRGWDGHAAERIVDALCELPG